MQSKQPVWDIWVRLGHWLIVAGIVFQQISGENLDLMDVHATVGILLLGWVMFRLVRGGHRPTVCEVLKFSDPHTANRYLRRAKTHPQRDRTYPRT